MGSQREQSYLNSCLKTPIDPCNNCPAPIYDRPKVYLGRLSETSLNATTIKRNVENPKSTSIKSTEFPDGSAIRSLVHLYDSIPNYCDINHLTEEEFYSTLDSLRSTCQELKKKPINSYFPNENSNSSVVSTVNRNIKNKKLIKKKTAGSKKNGTKKKKDINRYSDVNEKYIPSCMTLTPCSATCSTSTDFDRLSSNKEIFLQEVEDFKRTLKDYEDIYKNRALITSFKRTKSTHSITKPILSETSKMKTDGNNQTDSEWSVINKVNSNKGSQSKTLRKACSLSDLIKTFSETVNDDNTEQLTPINSKSTIPVFTNTECLAFKDPKKLSNYFPLQGSKCNISNEITKTILRSPSCNTGSFNKTTERPMDSCNSEKRKKKQMKAPFTIFPLDQSPNKKENVETPTPLHPVARPNLAATLRAENIKKKLQELQNNCTFYDRNLQQFDWEVRKTPAWRSLYLNESHKEILALRLATRKAEQALQQREYELNMELMRQRVKSAPLLLEGNTFWGPNVGKSTHHCQSEAVSHSCENTKRQQRKKTTTQPRDINKVYTLTIKSLSQPRNVQYSSCSHDHSQRANKSRRKPKKRHDATLTPLPILTQRSNHESGDDLCSADRAFL